ncbi:8-oxoguanine glycosylase ogg1 [Mitosporidium daphniae]
MLIEVPPFCASHVLAPALNKLKVEPWYVLPATRATLNLQACLEGGQAFNWVKVADEHWGSVIDRSIILLSYSSCDRVIFHQTGSISPENAYHYLFDYFRLNVSLDELIIKWRSSDKYFDSICDTFEGIRILRQDPLLTLLSFICSSNNNISRITKMVQSLHVNFGTPLDSKEALSFPLLSYAFPTIDQLSAGMATLETKLRNLGFGYRARFISETVKLLSELGVSALYQQRESCSYENVVAFLLQFPGVGRKID